MNPRMTAATAATTALFIAACGGEETPPTGTSTMLELRTSGLETLTQGVYEGWLIYGEEKVSTGVFTSPGDITLKTDRDPAGADKFAVTIEPDDDADPGPSGVVVLVGDIQGDGASLAFPADLASASGGFILRTPTDDEVDPANDEAGVWFLQMGVDGPEAGLDLPALPEGWVYEGWAVTQGTPMTTGRFSSPQGADEASPFSDGGPPFPGEDFVMDLPPDVVGPVDLADGSSMVVISVEPDMGGVDPSGDGPFAVKPLARMISADQPTATFIPLGAGPVPTVSGALSF